MSSGQSFKDRVITEAGVSDEVTWPRVELGSKRGRMEAHSSSSELKAVEGGEMLPRSLGLVSQVSDQKAWLKKERKKRKRALQVSCPTQSRFHSLLFLVGSGHTLFVYFSWRYTHTLFYLVFNY